MKPIINIDEVNLQPRHPMFAPTGTAAERFGSKMGPVAALIGGQKLGYNITSVDPGKWAFPAHNHWVNEEMVFVLEGNGEVTIGDQTYPIRVGDFVAFPPGGKASAHQIRNTGTQSLKYLAVSTKLVPEICEYPNSNKLGFLGEVPSSEPGQSTRFTYVAREGESVDYWEGE